MKGVFYVFIYLLCAESYGQVTFYDGTGEILGDIRNFSTVCIGVDDINGDSHDDLIVLDKGQLLKTYMQTSKSFPSLERTHVKTSNSGEWAMVSGDLTNDGIPELILSGAENGSEIMFLENGQFTTRQYTSLIYSQNSNLVDLNNDGFLDLFVCNDTGKSRFYLNNGQGEMIYADLIDFQTSPTDDMSGNYSSVFTDIDMDGDLDLYIGKCRAGVTDPADPRRVNTLYINEGDGTYREQAGDYGLAIGAQTWSVDVGDVDNDGDPDFLIANHDLTHDLMINNGEGNFYRFEGLPEDIKSYAIQSFFGDFDNNGWLDIFITESANSYILYNHNMNFAMRNVSHGRRPFSAASGDFNSDGFLDLYMGFASSFQEPGNKSDVVSINTGNANNFIDIHLQGESSNRDGIGAKVYVRCDDFIQYREILAGKSYGIMNSTTAHFGLGQFETIDEIRVEWPSGNTSYIYDKKDVNRKLLIQENGCSSYEYLVADREMCGEEVQVTVDSKPEQISWSTASNDSLLIVDQEGSFSALMVNEGCKTYTNLFEVIAKKDRGPQEIIIPDKMVTCNDELTRLSAVSGLTYEWSTGETTKVINVEEGVYSVTVSTNCDTYESSDFSITNIVQDPILIPVDTVFEGNSTSLFVDGENVNWYKRKYDIEPIVTANEWVTDKLYSDTTFFVGDALTGYIDEEQLMSVIPLNNSTDNPLGKNDSLDFEVFFPIRLNTISVRTQRKGKRVFEIFKGGKRIVAKNVNLVSGKNDIPLNITLDKGEYIMTTNVDTNMTILGESHPFLSYSEFLTSKEKNIKNVLQIGESRLYPSLTPYFFNWKVSYGSYTCDERYDVKIVVKNQVFTEEAESVNIKIGPNPVSNRMFIQSNESIHKIDVVNMKGEHVQSIEADTKALDFEIDVSAGMYTLLIYIDGGIVKRQIVVMLK